jgi:ABC-type glycerol-3-phosphate transport system permease component
MIFITKTELHPVQNILRAVLENAMAVTSSTDVTLSLDAIPPSEAVQSAVIIVTTLPIVLVYPFIQKYFVKGALVGAVKG